MTNQVLKELRNHAPFTMFGALTGILVMLLSRKLTPEAACGIFYILHPVHVILSSLVTASMYELHRRGHSGKNRPFGKLLLIGFAGSIGIATLSDSVIPYLGEILLSLPNRGIHIGFIEKWWLINPLAALGVIIAYYRPTTRFPHAGHVLLSTWASLFHIIMALGDTLNLWMYVFILLFLFLSVWVPCCLSDIVFPLLLINK